MAVIAPALMIARGTILQRGGMIAAIFSGVLLCACDTLPHARVINNAGADIVLRFDEGGVEREVSLANGRARVILAYGAPLEVRALDCRNLYVWPSMALNYPFKVYEDGYPVSVQVERDLKIYLAPFKTKAPVSAAALLRSQAHGFPLQPVRSVCRRS